MKILLKSVAALILLTLAVWAIGSDEREVGNVNAASLPAPAGGARLENVLPENVLLEDNLPAVLRGYVAGKAPATLGFPERKPTIYRLEKKDVPAGVEIRLANGPAVLAYTFEKEPPHRLVRFEREEAGRP
jgi:hypothetical protein